MKKIRMAVIGTGMAWERLHLPAIQELSDKYEVVAMANPTREKLVKAADQIGLDHKNIYQDYHEMIKRDDIDVVNIAVPISMNYIVSEEVAKAGKNIICEKPLGPTLEQAAKFVDFPKKYGIKVMIAENFRYNEENNIIRNMINEGKIGDVVYFINNNTVNFPEEMKKNTFAAKEWRQHPDFPGGMFLDAAVHDIAALRYIFGDVEKVSAFGKPQEDEFCPYTSINTNFLFQSGVIGHFVYWSKGQEPQKPAVGLRIFGTKGMIYLEERTCGMMNVFYNDGGHELIPYTPKRGYYNEFLNYYNALVGNEDIHVPPVVEFGDVKIVFEILQSVANQEVVDINTGSKYILQGNNKFTTLKID